MQYRCACRCPLLSCASGVVMVTVCWCVLLRAGPAAAQLAVVIPHETLKRQFNRSADATNCMLEIVWDKIGRR
ncbi:hypothetical protein COO60DRAFT_1482642 [Scenedesmus sp. NREL 46B-D3]|nr:hypothetical protein COO60DRAFT_1482642 [Scenedesmus sp. NREL 46B-D3]